jgi:hypothetical protein
MTEWLKESDFNVTLPQAWKTRKLKDANNALDIEARLILQIDHWSKIPDDNIFKKVILDELLFLRDGKV